MPPVKAFLFLSNQFQFLQSLTVNQLALSTERKKERGMAKSQLEDHELKTVQKRKYSECNDAVTYRTEPSHLLSLAIAWEVS